MLQPEDEQLSRLNRAEGRQKFTSATSVRENRKSNQSLSVIGDEECGDRWSLAGRLCSILLRICARWQAEILVSRLKPKAADGCGGG